MSNISWNPLNSFMGSSQFIKEPLRKCSNPLCKRCRKHASCLIAEPQEHKKCTSFEEGDAWDHKCMT